MNGQPACLSRKAANATPKGEPESMILRSLCSMASKSFTSEVCLSAKTVDHASRSRVRSGSKLMSTMKLENLRCLQKAAWSGLKPLGERDSHCACTSAGADRGEGEVGSRARDNKLQSTCTFVSSQPGIVRVVPAFLLVARVRVVAVAVEGQGWSERAESAGCSRMYRAQAALPSVSKQACSLGVSPGSSGTPSQ